MTEQKIKDGADLSTKARHFKKIYAKEREKEKIREEVKNEMKAQSNMIRCPNCKYEGMPGEQYKGSGVVEIALYLFILIPGIVYSLWRRCGIKPSCPVCQWKYVTPLSTLN